MNQYDGRSQTWAPRPPSLPSLLAALALACLVGCGGDDSNDGNNAQSDPDSGVDAELDAGDTGADAGLDAGPDAGPDAEPDTGDGGDTGDACEPLTECPADSCGLIDDGCLGTIDCGACACEGGAPVEPTCGPCGLGAPSCAPGAGGAPLESCELPSASIEALARGANFCDAIVYADASATPGGDGSAASPFDTLSGAIAASTSPGLVIVAGGSYPEALVARGGVSVASGYRVDAGAWLRDTTSIAEFAPPAPPSGPARGVVVEDVSSPTVIADVAARAPDAPPGESSYGAYLRNATGVEFVRVEVNAGQGGDGVDGSRGSNGANGVGGSASVCVTTPRIYAPGGAAGLNTSCPAADGGQGGDGAYEDATMYVFPTRGDPSATVEASGGRPGSVAVPAGDGDDGPRRTMIGTPGDGGRSSGEVANDLWAPGGGGGAGQRGRPGSGGGGGGGGHKRPNLSQDGVPLPTDLTAVLGGGGGGSGGCGGAGGAGGGAGGGSFGLFAVRSSATLVDSSFTAAEGGTGGAGGAGGAGGFGAPGGSGGERSCVSGEGRPIRGSGAGGAGSNGSAGGDGGGGAGGVSYGAYCTESTVTEVGTVDLVAGPAAAGGTGGQFGGGGATEGQLRCR